MQNLPILASAMPPQVNAAPVTLDTAAASGPDSEPFSAVLAREVTAKKSESKPDNASSGAATSDVPPQTPESALISPQIPPEPGLAAPPMLVLTPAVLSGQYASSNPPKIPLKTTAQPLVGLATSDQARGDQSTIALQPSKQPMTTVFPSDQPAIPSKVPAQTPVELATSDQPTIQLKTPAQPPVGLATSDPATLALQIPKQPMTGNFTNGQASRDQPIFPLKTPAQQPVGLAASDRDSGTQFPIPAKALPAPLATETSAPRNSPQTAHAATPVLESVNTANFAAPGKLLPPVAAEAKTSGPGMEGQMPQRLPEAAPSLQMTTLAITIAPLTSTSAPVTQTLNVDTRVGAPGWNGELAQKVVWMATQQHQVAELRLNPPNLGPVEVTLTVGNDQGAQTSIQFASPHLATREAIESALPRLREMMADNGIALGNVTVSADSFQQQAEAGRQDRHLMKQPADIGNTASGFAVRPPVSFIRSVHNGLVDTFA